MRTLYLRSIRYYNGILKCRLSRIRGGETGETYTTILTSIYKIYIAVIYGLRDRIKRRVSGGSGIGTQNGAYLILAISVATDTIKIERG